jgi:hypothetical protein
MPTAETIPSSLPIAERFGVTVPVAASYSGISKSRDLLRANCFRRRTGRASGRVKQLERCLLLRLSFCDTPTRRLQIIESTVTLLHFNSQTASS